MASRGVAVRCRDLVKTYATRTGQIRALAGIDAEFPAGALSAVVGPSGSGKSSLLRLVAGIDHPSAGEVRVGSTAMASASARALRRIRKHHVGYVFQRPADNFLRHLTVAEHLDFAASGGPRRPRVRPGALLQTLGMAGRADRLPSELSGGEQQRAAFAQVVMTGAEVIVADEPTAELDDESARVVVETMRRLVALGFTFLVATHDAAVRRAADHVVELELGRARVRTAAGSSTVEVASRALRDPTDPGRPRVAEVRALTKTYARGDERVHALAGATFDLGQGEVLGLVGRSGSGKTTLLSVLAGWERPDGGTVTWLRAPGRAVLPWGEVAVVPQKLGLIEEMSIRANVEYPLRLGGRLEERRSEVDDLLEALGLRQLQDRFPGDVSVGEQQRTAVARALVVRPTAILADEPTGHQDAVNVARIFDAFHDAASRGTCCVVATHNVRVIPSFDRVLSVDDGRVAEASAFEG